MHGFINFKFINRYSESCGRPSRYRELMCCGLAQLEGRGSQVLASNKAHCRETERCKGVEMQRPPGVSEEDCVEFAS